jgi:protein-disulfide isomerase
MSKLKMPVNEYDHKTGNANATIVLVEYGDYQCPHCGIAHPFIKKLLRQFQHKILFVFRNFPIQESHPYAFIAALTAEAAAKQNRFWEMHDIIFDHQQELDEEGLARFAISLNLDSHMLIKDANSDAIISRIENDFEAGVRSGVNGTPTFFINGNRLNNYDETYESLEEAIKQLELTFG